MNDVRNRRFGAYSLVREIGRGGMATVHEAVHDELGKRVAIKIVNETTRALPNGTARFFREARTVAQLRHPHIVDVVDIGDIDGRPCLVMELLEGEDLEAHLGRRGVLAPSEAVDLLLPVISAVAAAHERGVVHRDLKPSNVVLARRAGRLHPVVVDFGVSKRDVEDASASGLTHPEALVGTIPYMAPEQVLGARNASRWSDQYAIGVMLYRAMTGRLPFVAEGEYETMRSIVRARLVPPATLNGAVSSALEAVVMRAMHRRPAKRYASILALGRALLPFASAEATALWSGEMASDSEPRAPLASPLSATPADAFDPPRVPTRFTHVTEALRGPEGRRWHYRLLAAALALATGTVVVAGASLSTAGARAADADATKAGARKNLGARKDVLVDGAPPLEAVVKASPRHTRSVTVAAPVASSAAPPAAPASVVRVGPNGAPILE